MRRAPPHGGCRNPGCPVMERRQENMDKNMNRIQEVKKELEEKFLHAGNRCVETAVKGCCGRISISAGYTPAGYEPLESSYFMVTGEEMFPEYVRGLDSLAELICRLGSVIREQAEHISDGFYNEPFKAGHPLAVSPQEREMCDSDELPAVCAGFC